MKRVALFLPLPLIEAYKSAAKRLGLPFSELVRRALDAYIKENP